MQKRLLMRGLNFLCSKTSSFSFNATNPNYKTPSLASFHFHNFYTSKSQWFSDNPNSHLSENEIKNKNPPVDVEDVVSIADLKRQIDKLNKGDFEVIPTILESILKRISSRKPEESVDELMNVGLLQDLRYEVSDSDSNSDTDYDFSLSSDFDSDSYSDIDSDSDK